MKQNKITTLLFDLGEVVLTNDWMIKNSEKDREFYSYYRISREQFMSGRQKYYGLLSTGKISEVTYWQKVLTHANAVNMNPKKAIEISRHYQREKPGMIKLLTQLKSAGYRLAAITTSHKEIIAWKIRRFYLDRYFELIINSADVGILKPDPEIFRLTLKKLHVIPDVCIFIDDRPENISGAERIGIKGILFKDVSSLQKSFALLGIRI